MYPNAWCFNQKQCYRVIVVKKWNLQHYWYTCTRTHRKAGSDVWDPIFSQVLAQVHLSFTMFAYSLMSVSRCWVATNRQTRIVFKGWNMVDTSCKFHHLRALQGQALTRPANLTFIFCWTIASSAWGFRTLIQPESWSQSC